MIVFEIWNIEQGKWIEANFATIPLGHYYLRIRDKLTLEVKNAIGIVPENIRKDEGSASKEE